MNQLHLRYSLLLLFTLSIIRGFSQEEEHIIQVGDSVDICNRLGNCFLADAYTVTNGLPNEIEFTDREVIRNNFGSVSACFTISIPFTTSPGIYTGNLIYEVFEPGGRSCALDTIDFRIEVIDASRPIAAFSTFPTTIVEGGTVQFENLTTNPVMTWLWDFGEGATSNLENPNHTYNTPGMYTVCLTATGPGGTDSICKPNYIEVVEEGSPGISIWTFPTDGNLSGSPAIGKDGTIYFGSSSGKTFAINQDGIEKWAFNRSLLTPVIGPSERIYGRNGNVLYSISKDGSQVWQYPDLANQETLKGELSLGLDETIYIGTNSGKLYAIDSSAVEKWHLDLGASRGVFNPVVGPDGTIYAIAQQDAFVYSIVAIKSTGQLKWESPIENSFATDIADISIHESGFLLISGRPNLALDLDGAVIWQDPSSGVPKFESQFVIDQENNAYAINNLIYQLHSINPFTGKENWKIDLRPYLTLSRKGLSDPLIGQDGTIYLYSKAGKAFAFDKRGELIWEHTMVPEDFNQSAFVFQSAPAMGADGTLYMNYDDGKLHSVSTNSQNILDGKWSKADQNNQNTRSFACPFPFLNMPEDSSKDQAISPLFEWTPVFLANHYQVQISSTEDFSEIIESQVAMDTNFQAMNLAYGTYYWRVRPIMIDGDTACWSVSRSFSTVIAPPDKPLLISPALDTLNLPLSLTFKWETALRAERYQIQIAKDSGFVDLVQNLDTLITESYFFDLPENETKYYWRVRAINSTDNSPWSDVWSFTTIKALPVQSILISPENTAEAVPLLATFSWQESQDAEFYYFQVSTTETFDNLIIDSTQLQSTNTEVELPDYKTIYYWRIRGVNNAGPGPWSEVWSFTTLVARPSQPVLISPENNSENVPLMTVLNWQESLDAENYHLQISTKLSFDSLVIDTSQLVNLSFEVELPAYRTLYYWRVKAKNSTGDSPWSDTWAFTTSVATNLDAYYSNLDLNIYPNPASDKVLVSFNSPNNAFVRTKIYSPLGELIIDKSDWISSGKNNLEYKLSALKPGVYVLELNIGEMSLSEKILLMR